MWPCAREGRRVAAGRAAGAAHRLRPGRRPEQDRRQAADDLLRADAGQHARALRRARCRPSRSRSRTSPRCWSPPSSRRSRSSGARLDVTASSVGDARSLQGGTLLADAAARPDGSVVRAGAGSAVDRRLRRRQRRQQRAGESPHGRPRAGGALVQVGQPATLPTATTIDCSRCASRTSSARARVADAINTRARRRTRARVVDPATVRGHGAAAVSAAACPI